MTTSYASQTFEEHRRKISNDDVISAFNDVSFYLSKGDFYENKSHLVTFHEGFSVRL